MADATPARRVLPARQRRESAAKRRASSPPKPATPATPAPAPASANKPAATPSVNESKTKKRPEKRTKVVHVATPTRSASTPISTSDEFLPTKLTASRPLPSTIDKQADNLSTKQYQSIADSAIVAASLHRSRMQWLCDGVFKKYWTKPIKRKKAPVEEPPNNPDIKSMQKLGTATILIEPHSFEATIYVVREAVLLPPPIPRAPMPMPMLTPSRPPIASPAPVTTPAVQSVAPSVSATPPIKTPTPIPAPAPAPAPSVPTAQPKPVANAPAPAPSAPPTASRPATPPGGAKTTDPVIQMLASRAAVDNSLKDLMKVVATSRATPAQLKQFQAHIDEFNAIVKKQEAEKQAKTKQGTSTPPVAPAPVAASPIAQPNIPRSSPYQPGLTPTPTPHFASYSTQPRPEPVVKHVVIEFNSPLSATQGANPDRWLFPEYAVLDMQYGSTEMTCSFLVERKGSDVLTSMKELSPEEMQVMSIKWKANTEYFQPVTMVVKASSNRIIQTIAQSAKSLPDVQKYMREVMEKKTRAPQEYLVHRLPRDKIDSTVDFVDSAVEMSAEDDDLLDLYPL